MLNPRPKKKRTLTTMPQLETDAVSEDASVDAEEEIGENEAEYATASVAEDEPHEATPAHNAPDWLNAMVPGLDVDYEAAEDEFAEDEEEEDEPAAETQNGVCLAHRDGRRRNAATEERPQFAFSRPPAWLQPVNGVMSPQVTRSMMIYRIGLLTMPMRMCRNGCAEFA